MKKKIQTLAGGLALAAILVVNAYMAIPDNAPPSELRLNDLENIAEGERNPFYLWFSQGLNKDEREIQYVCYSRPVSRGCIKPYDDYSINPYDHYYDYAYTNIAIDCYAGNTNCTRVKCK